MIASTLISIIMIVLAPNKSQIVISGLEAYIKKRS